MLQPTQANARISTTLVFIVIVIVAASIVAVWYFKHTPTSLLLSPKTSTTSSTAPANNLGAALYNKVSDPVSGTLPSTFAPIPNPVNSFYVNPFR